MKLPPSGRKPIPRWQAHLREDRTIAHNIKNDGGEWHSYPWPSRLSWPWRIVFARTLNSSAQAWPLRTHDSRTGAKSRWLPSR